MGWFAVYVKKTFEEYKEKQRQAAMGVLDEPEEDALVGGMAKAEQMNALLQKVESLEARLVEAQVIKPKPKPKARWAIQRSLSLASLNKGAAYAAAAEASRSHDVAEQLASVTDDGGGGGGGGSGGEAP